MKNLILLLITLVTMTLSASAQTETIEKTIYVSVTNFGVTAPNNITDPLTYDVDFTVVAYNIYNSSSNFNGDLRPSFDETTGLYKFTVSYEHDITSNINNVVVDNKLSQNYPNPFESETNFDVNATESESYNISVYDMSGSLVNKYDFYLTKGLHNFTFDGGVSGNYILCVNSKNYSEKIKMTCVGNNSYINISHNGMSENIVENDVVYNTKSTMEDIIISCEETSIIEIFSYVGGYHKSLGNLNVSELVDGDTLYVEYHLFIDNRSDGYSENSFNVYPYYNVYNTVEVDGEFWMKENMRYLPSVNIENDWSDYGDTIESKYYVYSFNSNDVDSARSEYTNYATYGVLYNYAAAIESCPDGWSLPTSSNIDDLDNTDAIDLNLMYGGYNAANNGFYLIENVGIYSIDEITMTHHHVYNFDDDVITSGIVSIADGVSVRCVKD